MIKAGKTADRLFRWPFFLIALAVLLTMVYGYNSKTYDTGIDLKTRTITADSCLEAARMSDGSTVINDSAERILCISPKDRLKYHIDAGKNEDLTGMTLDGKDNLYLYRSVSDKGEANLIKDEIIKYNKKGHYVKTLYTINYSGEKNKKDKTIRTSPLSIHNGRIYFTRYLTYVTELYSIDLKSEKTELYGKISSDTAFFYNDVEGSGSGVYYYAKVTGEVGRGRIGGGQEALYTGNYNIREDTGFRPFYVRSVQGRIYVYDFWAAKIYELKNGRLAKPAWDNEGTYNHDVYELSVCGSTVMGISGNVPWYVGDNAVHKLPHSAKAPASMILKESLVHIVKKCALPLVIISGIFCFICLVWRVLVRGKHFALKLLFWESMLLAGFIAMTAIVFMMEYNNYIDNSMQTLRDESKLTAQIAEQYDISSIKNSSDIDSAAYRKITAALIDNYSIYSNSSDTAVLLLVTNDNGGYSAVSSNRGFGGLLGAISIGDDEGEALNKNGGMDFSKSNSRVIGYSPVLSKDGKTAGYLCLYTTAESLRSQFFKMWSPYLIGGYIALVIIIIMISARFFTRRLKKATAGIARIAEGDFDVRIPEASEDEIGSLTNCVNNLSKNVNDLIYERTRLTDAIAKGQYEVLASMASIVELKSGQTAVHVKRVSQCVRLMAQRMGYSGQELEYISIAATMHDIGKLFTPSEILEKPGKLTAEEFEVIKKHTVDGEKLLHDSPGPIMEYARNIALEHHEKWDGTGYAGLKGTEIKTEAAITAVADVFDALISKRVYKEAFPPEVVYDTIIRDSGKHFSPEIVDVFRECFDDMCGIISDYPDK